MPICRVLRYAVEHGHGSRRAVGAQQIAADQTNTDKKHATAEVTRCKGRSVVADGHTVPVALIARSVDTDGTDPCWGAQLRSSQHPVERTQQDYDPG